MERVQGMYQCILYLYSTPKPKYVAPFNERLCLKNHETFSSVIFSVEFLLSLDPALLSACLVALAGLIGVILGIILVHMNFNRKRLLLGSAFGTAVSFAGLGIYNMSGNINLQGKNNEIIQNISTE